MTNIIDLRGLFIKPIEDCSCSLRKYVKTMMNFVKWLVMAIFLN